MRIAKKILIWVCIALMVQIPIYYLADRYIMVKEDIRIYSKNMKVAEEKEDRKINLPITGDWKNINMSYNGKYLSYTQGKSLIVQNIDNNERVEVPFKEGEQLAYHTWIPERERMIIIEKNQKGKESVFSINYYDATNKEKIRVKDISHEKSDSYIQDVEVSLVTGIIYINIVSKGERSSLYRIDISENILAIDTKNYFIDKLSLVSSKDRLLYEDKLYDKVFYLDFPSSDSNEIKIDNEEEITLLGCDKIGTVYIGSLEDGKVTSIYTSKGEQNLKSWKKDKLNKPVDEESIYINNKGGFYIIDKEENNIEFRNNRVEIRYNITGEFLGFYNEGYIYKDIDNNIKNEIIK